MVNRICLTKVIIVCDYNCISYTYYCACVNANGSCGKNVFELSKHSRRTSTSNVECVSKQVRSVVQNCESINQSVIIVSGMVNIAAVDFDIEFFLQFVIGQGCYQCSL